MFVVTKVSRQFANGAISLPNSRAKQMEVFESVCRTKGIRSFQMRMPTVQMIVSFTFPHKSFGPERSSSSGEACIPGSQLT